ncbi:MAG: DUF4383 domain-containing protein [Gammaproteobacteria bacterium]|nr:DUF4383 domain-containing protein [Gammaproteobacteria bacterium]
MGNVQKLAVVFGIVLLAVGILGFVPSLTTDGMLFGIFEVDNMHNGVHLLTGVLALVAVTNASYTKLYFKIFGVIYAIVAVWGFVADGNVLMMHMNMADNVLHAVIAVVALFAGFMMAA